MVQSGPETVSQLSPESFNRIAGFITRELGIKMPESKLAMVQNRLARRTRDLGLASVEEYAEHVFEAAPDAPERIQFIDAVTTNKTDFFREPQHFEYLTRNVLPAITRSSAGQDHVITVWSAGCSSGEEPYTLAMLLSEYKKLNPESDFAILATDISSRVLERARAAIYSHTAADPVPLELRSRYLLCHRRSDSDLVRIVPQLRRKVSFHRLNFMDADYRVRNMFHAIFFRNVMIYFDRRTQESVIGKLCRNLLPGGYLFVGHSESLAGMNLSLQQVGTAIFRKPE
jgi:chemotaxis protein methyltransferase CheR